jgi:glutamate synthase (NADPH) small chain
MSKHVIDDAMRCLRCKHPTCSKGCPVNTPIRDAIALLLDQKLREAGALLFDNNPLSLVCCHVCPQESQCEGHCVLAKTGSPVQISAIEKYISDYYLNLVTPVPSEKTAGNVAIIGSGPAGITLSFLLSQRNYNVTLYDANDRVGGVLRYGIPEFRLPKRILDRLTDVLIQSGVTIRPNTRIGANITVDDLFRDGFNAIFVGTGVWKPYRMNLPGESLGNVHYAIDYLRNPDVYRLGKAVLIIGAGNVAMDVARTALRHGSEMVTVLSSRGDETVTARDVERRNTLIDGAKLLMNKTVVRFTAEGAVLADTDLSHADSLDPTPGTEELFPTDSVIIAVGQGPRSTIVSSTTGIDVTDRGLIAVDDCGHTSRPGVFASGDVVTGAKTVVEAVRITKRVADAMDSYIQSRRGITICE